MEKKPIEPTKPTDKKVWDKPRKFMIFTFPKYKKPSKSEPR
jgi:hypothetical protein